MRAEEGNIEPTARDALESMFNNGNPWGKPAAKRIDWMEGIEGVEKVRILEPGEKADVLVHTCCTAAYDPRIMPLAKTLVRVLEAAGVDYGFIGEEEKHCGSEARRLGEEGLFEYFDEENTELFGRYDVNRLVRLSPHCYEHLQERVPEPQPSRACTTPSSSPSSSRTRSWSCKNEIAAQVVFHDPCYLGKKNDVFDEPRYILSQDPGASSCPSSSAPRSGASAARAAAGRCGWSPNRRSSAWPRPAIMDAQGPGSPDRRGRLPVLPC